MNSDLPLDADLEIGKVPGIVLAEMLGEGIWEDLSECLIRNCLVYSIPTNSSKLQEYEEVKGGERIRFQSGKFYALLVGLFIYLFIYLLFSSYTLKKTVTIKSQVVLSHTFNSST